LSRNRSILLLDIRKGLVRTLIFPNRFAIEEATSIDAAAMMLVVKKREPSIPSLRWNFVLKNQITQELAMVNK
jgi:hypothetical protein